MRILLTLNAAYFPTFDGGAQADRLVLAALAERGHSCRVVSRHLGAPTDGASGYLAELRSRGIHPAEPESGVVSFSLDSVEVDVVTDKNIRLHTIEQITRFRPDVVMVATDMRNVLIADVVHASSAKVVYVSRTTALLPFGPDSAIPNPAATELLRRADAVVATTHFLANYIHTHSGILAVCSPIDPMKRVDWPNLGSFDNPFVTMVNPCRQKGISIFLGLADAFPDSAFAAVPTWGTTAQDLSELNARSNVRLLKPVDDVREILRQTRVLLAPSLWSEARGRIVTESMLCGVPVLASDRGGIPDAACGVDCLLPVNPIVTFRRCFDEKIMRVADIPAQDLAPWKAALRRLLDDRSHYQRRSTGSRAAALASLTNDISDFENLLRRITTSSHFQQEVTSRAAQ